MPRTRSLLILAGSLALLAPAGAQADEPLGSSARGTAIVADSGYAAWRADDGRLALSTGAGARSTSLRPPASAAFDVGARRGGAGAQVAWAEGCSTRSGRCAVRAATLSTTGTLRAPVVAHIPYRGGGSPAVAVQGAKLAYAVRVGRCDVPYVRTLPSGSARRLDRGHCARISQLDLTATWVGALAHPTATFRATEARIVRTSGGRSRTLQRESQGEESNFIGSIAFDGAYLYTSRAGLRQANAFTRWSLSTRTRSDARAFVSLQGAASRDHGRMFYVQTEDYEGAGDCPCAVVGGSDPWSTTPRRLIPDLTLDVSPQPVYVDSDPSALAALTRRTVSRITQVGAPAPVPGVTVELLAATATDPTAAPPAPAPTGATAVTGADGVATIRIPGAVAPRRFLAAVTRPAAGEAPIPTSFRVYLQSYVHMTAAATRLADGRLQVTGTIAPAQRGRKVRLDRKLDRICNEGGQTKGSLPSPSQSGVPAPCFDRYTQDPVATATVSPDGGSYTLVAPASAPAGTYAAGLNLATGTTDFPGETTGFAAP